MAIVLADNTPRIEYTVAQGVTQTVFPIPFVFFNKEDSSNVDVKVFVDGVERTLGSISTTTFSITSGGNGAKGSLSTTVTGASGGSTVIVLRDTKIGRTTDFPSGGAFEVSKLNTELDTLVAIEGDFEDHVSRSIRLQDKDTAVSLALPLKADRLGKQLGFHATTGAVQMFTPESLAIASDSGSGSVDLTSNTFTFTGGEGIDTSISNQTLTITGELASTSNKGVASFNSTNFTVSSGAVTANDITLASDSGSATNTLGETFTLSGGTGLNTSATGSTVTMNVDAAQTGITSLLATDIKIGEDDQTKIDFETADQINFYANNVNVVQLSNANSGDAVFTVPTSDKDFVIKGNDGGSTITALTIDMSNSGDASFNNNVTVGGNLTVNGSSTTVNTATLTVEDPLISLASGNNSADSVDIGFYGLYDTSGSQDLYAGLFRDASDSGKFKLFKDLQAEPTTTVNTSGTGYAIGTLVANLEGTIQTAAQTNITSLGTLTGLTSSGTINTVTTGIAIQPASDITSNDVVLIRANPSGSFGFDIKYMGSRSGTANSYSLFMHNQTGSHIEAMTVFQDGKVGINQTTPTASLHVGDTALFDDDVTFTGTNGNIVFDKSDDALEFADNVKAVFGTGSDLLIYHDGNDSNIWDNGSGNLKIISNGSQIALQSPSVYYARGIDGGAFELYHNGTKKFETTSTGSRVYGNFIAEDGYVGFGDSSADNWGKLEFLGSDPTGFSSQFDNAVAIVNEQGSTNQRIFLLDTGVGNSGDLFGVSAQNQAVFSVLGTGDLKFKRPNGNTTHDITLACPTPTAARTITLPDLTGTVLVDTGDQTLTGDFTLVGDADNIQFDKSNNALEFKDSMKAIFGTGEDLIITHNSGASIIKDNVGNPLYLQTNNTIHLTKNLASETMAKFIGDGAVELYHNNVKKFETETNGVTVTGRITATSHIDINNPTDSGRIEIGGPDGGFIDFKSPFTDDFDMRIQSNVNNKGLIASDNLHLVSKTGAEDYLDASLNGAVNLYYDNVKKLETTSDGITVTDTVTASKLRLTSTGDASLSSTGHGLQVGPTNGANVIIDQNEVMGRENGGTDTLNIQTNGGIVFIGQINPADLKVNGNITASSTASGNTDAPILKLTRNSPSPAVNDILGSVRYLGKNDADQDVTYAEIDSIIFDETDGTENGALRFTVPNDGTQTVYLTLGDGNARFQQNARFDDNVQARFGTSSDLKIYHNGNNSYIDDGSGTGALIFKSNFFSFRNSSDAAQMAIFSEGGSVRLFHNGADKFNTLSTGAKVFGDFTIENSDDDANANPSLIIDRGSSSPANSDAIGEIIFRGRDSGGGETDYANIATVIADVTDPQEDAYLRFRARVGGANIQHIQCGFSSTDIFGRLRVIGNNHFSDPVIIFEGQTADAHETELKVVDPTADRTILFPDASGDVVLNESGTVNIRSTADGGPILNLISNDHSDATDFHKEAIINFKADNDANEEITFAAIEMRPSDVSDGTEDGRVNFLTQESGGGLTTSVMVASSQFILNHDDHKIVWNNTKGTNHEVSLTVNTPTASRTITLPDATGEVIVTSGGQTMTSHLQFADNAQLRIGDGNDLVIRHDGGHSLIEDNGTGDLYIRASDNLNIQADNGSGGWHNAIQTQFTGSDSKVAFFNGGTQVFSTLSNGISIDVSGGIRFEGATADGNETFLQVADPTADRTITLPDATGTVALTSQLSDIRDKKDVQDLQLGLDFVNAMRPVQFTWDRRDGSYNDVKELGFIAQELDQVERQFDTKDRTKLVTEMSEDELHVSPMNSYPILVKAIQELSAQVESLQARVKELEG